LEEREIVVRLQAEARDSSVIQKVSKIALGRNDATLNWVVGPFTGRKAAATSN